MTDDEREAEVRRSLAAFPGHPNTAAVFLAARLDHERAQHDRRVVELLRANTLEVERRRAAEAIVHELAEWHERASGKDGDDFLNGNVSDGRNGHDEIETMGERALALMARRG